VSTLDQHIDSQRDRLTAAGCDKVWIDHGVSGKKTSRPNLDRMLADMQPGDEVHITKLDRLGRSVRALYEATASFEAAGVELVGLDQDIDTRSRNGKLMFGMLALIAEWEHDMIIERTRDGQAAVRRGGNMRRILAGQPPLGFCEDPDQAGDDYRDWVRDHQAGRWLAEVAARILADPLHRVDTAFQEQTAKRGPMTDAAGRQVNIHMLRKALVRPASAGYIEVNGERFGSHPDGGPLDVETWEKLRLLFGSRRSGRPPMAGKYPFGELLACDRCGNQLSGKPLRGRPYYGCNNPHKQPDGSMLKPCNGVSVFAEDVHRVLRAAVTDWQASDAYREIAATLPVADDRRAELLATIAEQQEANAELWAKRQRGHLSPIRYKELSATAERLIDEASAELELLADADAAGNRAPAKSWDDMSESEQRAAIEQAVITPIRVRRGNGGGAALSAADRMIMRARS
jgi:hypothetical protein